MKAGAKYLAGVLIVGVGAAIASAALPAAPRPAVWLATVLALVVQGPLGWWVVRSLGEARLLRAWGAGMLARFGLLAAAAWVIAPLAGVPTSPMLLALATLLLALLFVEVVAIGVK